MWNVEKDFRNTFVSRVSSPQKKMVKDEKYANKTLHFFALFPSQRMQKKLRSVFDVVDVEAEHDFTKRFHAKNLPFKLINRN